MEQGNQAIQKVNAQMSNNIVGTSTLTDQQEIKYTVNPISTILDNTVAMHAQNNLKDLVVTTVNKSNVIAIESSIKPQQGMASTLIESVTDLAEAILDEYGIGGPKH